MLFNMEIMRDSPTTSSIKAQLYGHHFTAGLIVISVNALTWLGSVIAVLHQNNSCTGIVRFYMSQRWKEPYVRILVLQSSLYE